MPHSERLRSAIAHIDRRSYPAYRDLKGTWEIGELTILLDHVQGDPYASPSRLRVRTPTGIRPEQVPTGDHRMSAEDWLLRQFVGRLRSTKRGSGKSGQLRAYHPGPEVIERSALRLLPDGTAEIRFQAGLPAQGRRVLGNEAWRLLTEDIPRAAAAVKNGPGLQEHIQSVCMQRHLREQLDTHQLIAFIANGSRLPRESGVSQKPLPDAVPFQSPPGLEISLDTPWGSVTGMGIPAGITLIVGGGFHGKSTLLHALQRGHMDHIPGDGREQVVAHPHTVKIRAEDGRRVERVNISPFLATLPGGKQTEAFCTEDASGSTSQAANIIEAVEAGASTLLLDEDTSATNLLVRDARMRRLIPKECEPITPLVERIRQMYSNWGTSVVMVIGGVGDYLAIADQVILMENYRPREVTKQARELADPAPKPPGPLSPIQPRVPLRAGLAPGKIRARNEQRVGYGDQEIELSAVEQILDVAHAASIAEALRLLHELLIDDRRHLITILDALDAILDDEGVEALAPRNYPPGDLIRPRRHEVAAALSRHRQLRVAQTET